MATSVPPSGPSVTERLIDDWHVELHRLWSLRVGLFFFALNGFLIGLAAFDKVLNPFLYLGVNVAGHLLAGAMRLLKQAPRAAADDEGGAA